MGDMAPMNFYPAIKMPIAIFIVSRETLLLHGPHHQIISLRQPLTPVFREVLISPTKASPEPSGSLFIPTTLPRRSIENTIQQPMLLTAQRLTLTVLVQH